MNEIEKDLPTPDGQDCNAHHRGCQLAAADAAGLSKLGGRTVVDALAEALARIDKLEQSANAPV